MFNRIVDFKVVIDNEFNLITNYTMVSFSFLFFLCDHEQEIAIAIYSARARGILLRFLS